MIDRKCKVCGIDISKRWKNAINCKDCTENNAKKSRNKYRRKWAKKHRIELNKLTRECQDKQALICKVLKKRYDCKNLNELMKYLKLKNDK